MKSKLPESFHLIRGMVIIFLALFALGFFLSVVNIIYKMAGNKRLPLFYRTEKIDLRVSGKTENDILLLGYFSFNKRAQHQEGDITLHSTTGKAYQAYYSPKLEKLRVIIPKEFSRSFQVYTIIFYLVNLAIVLVMLSFIIRLLNSLEEGSPFTIKNGKYIGIIAAVIFWFVVACIIYDWIIELYIESEFSITFMLMPEGAVINGLLFAVVLAILSYILRQGIKMKEDQDLTI